MSRVIHFDFSADNQERDEYLEKVNLSGGEKEKRNKSFLALAIS